MREPRFWSDDPDIREQFELIQVIWNRFDETGETGQTSREVVERYRAEVSDCFQRGPSAFYKAISLMAELLAKMSGDST